MKTILVDILLLLALFAFYYTGAYAWFSSKIVLICALLLVAIVLGIAFIVFGSPFERGKDDD